MSQLEKIVKLTKAQYETLSTSGTVGSLTGLNNNYLYFVTDETVSSSDLGNDFLLDVPHGGTGKDSFTVGSVLVGNGTAALTELTATNANTFNTIVKRDSNGDFEAGLIKIIRNNNTVTIGSQNSGWCHIYNSQNWPFIFNNSVAATGGASSTATLGTAAYPFHQLILGGSVTATMTSASTGPRITFQEGTGTQPVHLIYTDIDNYRAPAGLKVIGGASANPAWFEVEGSIFANGGNRVPHTGNTNGTLGNATKPVYIDAGQIKEGDALKNLAYIDKPSSDQTTKYLRGDGSWVTLSDMGLSTAMHYRGTVTANPTTTTPTGTYTSGDVLVNSSNSKEFVYDGTNWREIGDESSFKVKQSTVSSPTADGTATAFIDTISQDDNGEITVTKSNLPTATTAVAGIIQIGTGASNAMAGDTTVTNVAISANTTATNNYPVLFATSNTATTGAKTEGVQKSGTKFYFNPNSGNLTVTKINGYSLSASCEYDVLTTTSGFSSSTKLPTAQTIYNYINAQGYTSAVGTVTSVRVQAASPLQSSSSAAATNSLSTTISFISQTANYVLAGPSSGSATAAPTFRQLVAADLPSHTHNYISSHANGYGVIKVSAQSTSITSLAGSSTSATISSTTHNESINFNTANKWIVVKGTNSDTNGSDKIEFGHYVPDSISTTSLSAQEPGYGSTFNIPSIAVDQAGHVTGITTTTVKIPASDNSDTKNTAGASATTTKIFLVGTTAQSTSAQTYSNTAVYTTNGALSAKTLGVNADTTANKVTLQWNTTDSSLDFIFA